MAKKIYVCPKCKQTVELFVTPSEPPQCVNYDAHRSRKYTQMEEMK